MYSHGKNSGSAAYTQFYYLDFLRFLAISMVILLHVVSGVSDTIPEQMTAVQLHVYESIKLLCASGVPVFLMISGALFLAPEKKIGLRALFGKYIRRIVLALVLFGTFYALLELLVSAGTFRAEFLLQAFYNMLTGNSWAHMWYLYTLLGLYLFLPFLKAFTAYADENVYRYVLILLFVVSSLLPLLKRTTGFAFGVDFPVNGIYVFYYLCGYYLHVQSKEKNRKLSFWLCAGGVLSVLVIVVNTAAGTGLAIEYDSPFVVLPAMAVFCLAKRWNPDRLFCTGWRSCYFSMYLVHTFFLNIAYKFLHITPLIWGGYVLLPVFWAADFILSLASARILLKIPPLKKYVL